MGTLSATLSGSVLRPLSLLADARGLLFPWTAVLIGCGIGFWFALPWEPQQEHYATVAIIAVSALAFWRFGPELWMPLAVAVICVSLGFLACGVRLWSVSAPMLEFRYYGPVTGRVIEIDRSQTDALRLTLDQVWLERVETSRTPQHVRVSLRAKVVGHEARPGDVVMMTAHLAAPEGPAEPGAFDFRRGAFFEGLGAVGYTTTPVMLWQTADPSARVIDRMRSYLSRAMLQEMPSQAGAFAAGAMTGDRSGITLDTVQDLRDSSLAHLLAISGMNLAFLIGFVFGLVRYGLALIPYVALRVNTKKVAAIVSLAVAAFYLALSGANVATERAFIMVSVVLGAVLLDRKALTLRSAALAAIILLLWQPESLLEPGFQMSFAATIALIAGFREVDRRVLSGRLPRWGFAIFTLVLSSLIGGFATAPFAAAHFNRFSDYGLLANLATVPVMGAVVMPAGAIAALLAPFGLAGPALWVMERGSAWILFVADVVASWEGSVTAIPTPPFGLTAMIALSGLWVILLRERVRLIGVLGLAVALGIWAMSERPSLLISGDGALVGVLGPEGRALSAPRGAGFVARAWLENDGDLVSQEIAASRPGFAEVQGLRRFEFAGFSGVALKGKAAPEHLDEACAGSDLVVIAAKVDTPPKDCVVFDQTLLRQTGPLAAFVTEDRLRFVPTNAARRAWSLPEADGALPFVLRSTRADANEQKDQ